MAGFMRLQVWRERMTLRVDPESGDPRFVPESEAHGYGDLPEIIASEIEGYAEPNIGGEGSMAYFSCYSAPGYMDRTETSGPWPTAMEALCSTFETYASDEADEAEAVSLAGAFGIDPIEARFRLGLDARMITLDEQHGNP